MSGPINIDALKAKHRRGKSMIRAAVDAAAQEAADDALLRSNQSPEFRPRTGALQAATTASVLRLKSGAKIVLKNAKAYAAAIDRGARPHVIRPRRAKMLRFVAGGGVVFARKVNHPGNRAYRFLYRAAITGHRKLQRRLEARLASVARKF
jgi:hypothetical protein